MRAGKTRAAGFAVDSARRLFVAPAKFPNIANRIGNFPIERHRPRRSLSDGSPQRSGAVMHAHIIMHIGCGFSVNSCVI